MRDFDHEGMDVYKAAADFVVLAQHVLREFPRGWGDLGNQLRRASISIVLNIAEGAGEFARKDKARLIASLFGRRTNVARSWILRID